MAWLQIQGIAVRGVNVVTDCIAVVAQENRVHPVREYLAALEWDGTKRLDTWLQRYFNAEGSGDYLAAVGACWLVSAVARVEQPGCKADSALVLESRQGARKSSAAACLAIRPQWFADSVGDLRSKDSAIQLAGKWIVELAELSSIRRAEVEAVKSYLSRTHDVFRPPYGRRAVTVSRQCVFVGTTNEAQYLRDRTGNRRYWPIRCADIDLETLERDRDQLWAEALHEYRTGAKWYLSAAQETLAAIEQDDRLQHTELDVLVGEFLDRIAEAGQTEVTTRAVFIGALRLDANSEKYAETTARLGTHVAAAIESAGWHKVRRIGKARHTVYRQGDTGRQGVFVPLYARAYVEESKKSLSTPVTPSRDCPTCDGSGCDMCGEYKTEDGKEL
jgi:predicted P-loop ATPase